MRKYHLVRRADAKIQRTLIYYAIGILVSLSIGAVLLAALGINPFEYYGKMLTIGLIGNKYGYKSIEGLLKIFVPLLITSLALSLSFKMRFWNIGGEGEFLIGAIAAAVVAFNCSGLPNFVTVLLMCLAAMISSGIIGIAVAALKVKFNTNETLMTLMINYIMLYVIKYLGETKADWNFFLRADSERPIFGSFPDSAVMGGIPLGKFKLLWSVIIAIVLTAVIYVYLKYTKQGYEVSVVGDSSATAKYAGMNVGNRFLYRIIKKQGRTVAEAQKQGCTGHVSYKAVGVRQEIRIDPPLPFSNAPDMIGMGLAGPDKGLFVCLQFFGNLFNCIACRFFLLLPGGQGSHVPGL